MRWQQYPAKIDKGHLMTFHPRGRTTSATWFNDREMAGQYVPKRTPSLRAA